MVLSYENNASKIVVTNDRWDLSMVSLWSLWQPAVFCFTSLHFIFIVMIVETRTSYNLDGKLTEKLCENLGTNMITILLHLWL